MGPVGLSVSPDGKWVYVINEESNTVSVINTVNNAVIDIVNVGLTPNSQNNFITGCNGLPVTFTITVNPESFPTITTAGTLSPLTTVYGTPSTSTTFTVSGTNSNCRVSWLPHQQDSR